MTGQNESPRWLRYVIVLVVGVVVFGVAVAGLRVFYRPPARSTASLDTLLEQKAAFDKSKGLSGGTMSHGHEAFYRDLLKKIAAAQTSLQTRRETWSRNAGLVMIVVATLLVIVSLVVLGRLRIVADGVLLGGLSTLAYSVVLSFSGPASATRYVVLGMAVLVAGVATYLRLSSQRDSARPTPAAAETAVVASEPPTA